MLGGEESSGADGPRRGQQFPTTPHDPAISEAEAREQWLDWSQAKGDNGAADRTATSVMTILNPQANLIVRLASMGLSVVALAGTGMFVIGAELPVHSQDRVLIDHTIEQRSYWCKNALQKKYPKASRFQMAVVLAPASQKAVNTGELNLQGINRQGLAYTYAVDLAGKRYEGICTTGGNGKVARLQQSRVLPTPSAQ